MDNPEVSLRKATIDEAPLIHAMQVEAFASLLEKFQDHDSNPGAERIERVIGRLRQENTDFYLILFGIEPAGAVRIARHRGGDRCRISPLFIIPRFQGKGLAQATFRIIEGMYHPSDGWELDTILEESRNCHLYEKLGYKRTGRIDEVKEGMHIVHYEKLS